MKGILVVKFGGSCLTDPKNVRLVAEKILAEHRKNKRVVVVVSALTGVTDFLLKTASEASDGKIGKEEMDEILSMGERTSQRIITGVLKAMNAKVVGLDPSSDLWPIFTDSNHGCAEVDLDKTCKATREKLLPLLEQDYIVVVPGFIGLSPENKITTLGRGGSDITAVVLGRCLDAEEVVFVKDVGGVLSADPKLVSGVAKVEALDVEEMYSLSSAGAKVLHPKSLKYKTSKMILRVVGMDEPDLSGGTIIKGALGVELNVTLHDKPLAMVSVVGWELSTPESLTKIFAEAAKSKAKIMGLTMAPPSLLLYVENPETLIERLNRLIREERVAKAVHKFEPLALITVSGPGLEEIPGVVDKIAGPIASRGINLLGIMTISSSVRVFVAWKDKDEVLNLIRESLALEA